MKAELPRFETPRLLVSPRALEDLEPCVAMDREPEVMQYIPPPWSSPDEHRGFVRDRILRAYPPGLGYWSLRLKDPPCAFAGWVLLIPYDAVGPEIEIGWRLRPAFWGRGYAAEAAVCVLHHSFAGPGPARVIADIHPENRRSQRVAEKIGLSREHTVARPLWRYAATRQAWLSR